MSAETTITGRPSSPRILVVAMRHNYGDPARGLSYEFQNIFTPLARVFGEVHLFDFLEIYRITDKETMNRRLLEEIDVFKPDIAVFSLYQNEFDKDMVRSMASKTKTMVMFLDDVWRSEFSRFWGEVFDLVATSDIHGETKFREAGIPNVMFFPYGCDHSSYRKLETTSLYDVSFVGSCHPRRKWLISLLHKAGIRVHVAGHGWPGGAVSHQEIVQIFNESKINLNLSNSSSWDLRYLLSSPRALRDTLRSSKTVEQIKARHFEINGCGAFQLTQYAEGIERIYKIGEEIAIFTTPEELVDKARYYLEHEDLRGEIAEAGHRRTLADHTTEGYFRRAFARLGPWGDASITPE